MHCLFSAALFQIRRNHRKFKKRNTHKQSTNWINYSLRVKNFIMDALNIWKIQENKVPIGIISSKH